MNDVFHSVGRRVSSPFHHLSSIREQSTIAFVQTLGANVYCQYIADKKIEFTHVHAYPISQIQQHRINADAFRILNLAIYWTDWEHFQCFKLFCANLYGLCSIFNQKRCFWNAKCILFEGIHVLLEGSVEIRFHGQRTRSHGTFDPSRLVNDFELSTWCPHKWPSTRIKYVSTENVCRRYF